MQETESSSPVQLEPSLPPRYYTWLRFQFCRAIMHSPHGLLLRRSARSVAQQCMLQSLPKPSKLSSTFYLKLTSTHAMVHLHLFLGWCIPKYGTINRFSHRQLQHSSCVQPSQHLQQISEPLVTPPSSQCFRPANNAHVSWLK